MNNDFKMFLKRHAPFPRTLAAGYRAVRSVAMAGTRRAAGRLLNASLEQMHSDRPRVWFFGVPTHNNLGDLAQWICIRDWLNENFPSHALVEVTSDALHGATSVVSAQLKRLVDPKDDLVVMQSGYTMDGLHPDELAHAVVPALLPNARTVFFPQTILYRSAVGLRRIQSTLRESRRVLLLARDPHSLDLAQKHFPDTRTALFPDIVTSLIGRFDATSVRSGILLCARDDGEKHYSSSELATLARALEALGPLTITDTSINLGPSQFAPVLIRRELDQVIRHYSQFRVVVTDRYHGTIFAVAAGTPVVVLRTTDHKVTSGAKWLSRHYPEHVYSAGSIEEASEISRWLSGRATRQAPGAWPEEHYRTMLRRLIDGL